MGSLSSGRPGGNPDFGIKYRFEAGGNEPLDKHLQLRITASMRDKLDKLGDRKVEFIREAIGKALDELDELEEAS